MLGDVFVVLLVVVVVVVAVVVLVVGTLLSGFLGTAEFSRPGVILGTPGLITVPIRVGFGFGSDESFLLLFSSVTALGFGNNGSFVLLFISGATLGFGGSFFGSAAFVAGCWGLVLFLL